MKPMGKKEFSRHLRKSQNTYEDLLWQLLRNRRRCNKKFRRQHAIGPYNADFYRAEERLVIEIDGQGHFTEEATRYDEARDRFMNSQGIRVLRFTGKQVELETNLVLTQIDNALSPSTPDPFSPEYRGEGE